MTRKYTAVLLAVMVVAAQAANLPQPLILGLKNSVESLDERTWDGLGYSADVNEYVDKTLYMLAPFIQEYGLDPMALPDVVEGFSVRPILVTYSAWLKIHDGAMTGLVNLARSGDQTVNYFAKMLRVRVELQLEDLQFDYRYLVQVMNIGPTGGIRGTLSKLVVAVDLLIDFNNDEVHLQEFRFAEIGRLRVRLTGNILTDWLVNPVIGVFVSIFDNIIIKVVEVNIRKGIQDGIDVINAGVKGVLEHIESL